MSLLYDVIIAPLVFGYSLLYAFLIAKIGYGYGLLALSVIHTLLLTPLRSRVAATQEEERRLQAVLAPQMAAIKTRYSGIERHRAVQRLFRRYAYHPFLSIRAFYGLLLQVPFIIAAYEMLVDILPPEGASFWLFPNLSLPDHMLPGDINALPLVMTAVNLLAAFADRAMTRRDKLQAVIIAALFLALLYHAPAAMLIYWTCNNLLSLAEALRRRWLPSRSRVDDVILTAPPVAIKPREAGVAEYCYISILLGTLVPWLATLWHKISLIVNDKPYIVMFDYLDLLLAALLLAVTLWRIRLLASVQTKRSRYAGWLIVCYALGLAALLGWQYFTGGRVSFNRNGNLAFYLFPYMAGMAVVYASLLAPVSGRFTWFWRHAGAALYWPSALVLAVLVFIFSPAMLYQSSPDLFGGVEALAILGRLLPVMLFFLYALGYLRLVLPGRVCRAIGLAMGVVALAGLYFSLLNPPDGVMDGDAFVSLRETSLPTAMATDAVVFALSLLVLGLCFRFGRLPTLARLLGLFVVILAGFGIYTAVVVPPVRPTVVDTVDNLPALEALGEKLLSLSPDKPNVVVIMSDAFFGGSMEWMVREEPELLTGLPGFIWYRDTLSEGQCTLLTFPALLGGPDYSPLTMNRNPELPLVERVRQAYTDLSLSYMRAGYRVCLFGVDFGIELRENLRRLADGEGMGERLFDTSQPPFMAERMMQELDLSQENPVERFADISLVLSLFRTASMYCRELALEKGYLIREEDVDEKAACERLAALYFLPRLVTADATEPAFAWYYSMFSHAPWELEKDAFALQAKERRVRDARLTLHHYTDRHALLLLAQFGERLKQLGVYDNTRIIFVSDHNGHPTEFTIPDAKRRRALIRPYPVLLVKDFGASGDFAVSDALMQCGDVPALASAGVPGLSNPPKLSDTGPGRVRYHSYGPFGIAKHGTNTWKVGSYRVTGSMFGPENWEFVSPEAGDK